MLKIVLEKFYKEILSLPFLFKNLNIYLKYVNLQNSNTTAYITKNPYKYSIYSVYNIFSLQKLNYLALHTASAGR
jgi:hypothetical protein